MPKNKNFQLRIEILDELLSSLRRRNMLELMDILNERLVEEGESRISRRTFYDDLNYLENKLGAPIKRATKVDPLIYYFEKFSIKNVPIDEEDVSLLRQAIEILKKATDLNIIKDIDDIVTKLENKVHTNVPNRTTMIAFEEHTKALGQEHLDDLFNAVLNKCALKISYQPFGKEIREWIIHPYLLKEYRNRWYVIGRISGAAFPVHLALDRIKKLSNCMDSFEENNLFDPNTYFNDLIGVSYPDNKVLETIILKVSKESADYILTKPIHRSQQLLKKYADDSIKIQITLFINFELKAHLLSYGPKLEVLEPESLRLTLKHLYNQGHELYL
ncbi:MAG: WYL domain-containing protein [Flavobacterium sp.]|nr:MAG: WYL domain-containing protein [Flavobacterium sp.]